MKKYEIFINGSIFVDAEDEDEAENKAVEAFENDPIKYMEVRELDDDEDEEEVGE